MFFVGYSVMFTSRIMKLVARLTNIVPVDPDAHLLRAMKAGAYWAEDRSDTVHLPGRRKVVRRKFAGIQKGRLNPLARAVRADCACGNSGDTPRMATGQYPNPAA